MSFMDDLKRWAKGEDEEDEEEELDTPELDASAGGPFPRGEDR